MHLAKLYNLLILGLKMCEVGEVTQVVEYLSSKLKVLSSTPAPTVPPKNKNA
jgi:hypothetical protein